MPAHLHLFKANGKSSEHGICIWSTATITKSLFASSAPRFESNGTVPPLPITIILLQVRNSQVKARKTGSRLFLGILGMSTLKQPAAHQRLKQWRVALLQRNQL
jgi:hypothetical protein